MPSEGDCSLEYDPADRTYRVRVFARGQWHRVSFTAEEAAARVRNPAPTPEDVRAVAVAEVHHRLAAPREVRMVQAPVWGGMDFGGSADLQSRIMGNWPNPPAPLGTEELPSLAGLLTDHDIDRIAEAVIRQLRARPDVAEAIQDSTPPAPKGKRVLDLS
jgi:hypothetical protein